MLVLVRKKGEGIKLVLPDKQEITIRCVRIAPTKVHVGITAPERCTILREELATTARDQAVSNVHPGIDRPERRNRCLK